MTANELVRELRRSGTSPHALDLLTKYGRETGGDAAKALEKLALHVDTAPAGMPRKHRLPRVTRGTMAKGEAVLRLGKWPDDVPSGKETLEGRVILRPVALDELRGLVEDHEAKSKTPAADADKPTAKAGLVEPVCYNEWTREELYAEATRRDLHGRSGLDKEGLVEALEKDDKEQAEGGDGDE